MGKNVRRSALRRGRIQIPNEKVDEPSWIPIIITLLLGPELWWLTAILGFRKFRASWKNKKLNDYMNYAAIIGSRSSVSVSELVSRTGKDASIVVKDLKRMVELGYLGDEAYLDHANHRLVIWEAEGDEETYSYAGSMDDVVDAFRESASDVVGAMKDSVIDPLRLTIESVLREVNYSIENGRGPSARKAPARPAPVRQEEQKPEAAPEQAKPAASTKPKQAPKSEQDVYEQTLRRIQDLNDRIADAAVSERIDRIGSLTASIFRVVREKPEHMDEVRKFMNYYLPTTFKLLESYALMEGQSYQGSNIAASRKKIEGILDQLVVAFEQQQDKLFKTEAMDVDAEIRVLKTMMAKDGLSGNDDQHPFQKQKPMGGH